MLRGVIEAFDNGLDEFEKRVLQIEVNNNNNIKMNLQIKADITICSERWLHSSFSDFFAQDGDTVGLSSEEREEVCNLWSGRRIGSRT